MEVTRVNRITIPAHLLLRSEGTIGWVHSVFRRGLNVVAGGRIIHVQWERGLNSPFSLALNEASPFGLRESVREGDEVVKLNGRLRIGLSEWIAYAPEEFYDPCVRPVRGISGAQLGQMLRFLTEEMEGFRKRIPSVNFLSETEAIITSQTEGLLASLTRRDLSFERLMKFIGRLIGLGPGLTPMGDDFIIGIMGTLARFRTHSKKVGDFFRNLREAVTDHLSETSAISSEFLRYASLSCFSEKMNDLLYLMSHRKLEEEKLKRTIQSAFDFGSTSGMGNLLGIYDGLRIFSALCQNGEEGNG